MSKTPEDLVEKKYKKLIEEFEHAKFLGVLYHEFQRSNPHGYHFGGLDFFTQQDSKDGSWDTMLYSESEKDRGRLKPIFVEAKGTLNNSKSLTKDIDTKIIETEKIMNNPEKRNIFFNQPGINLNVEGLSYKEGDAEYVCFLNEIEFKKYFFDPKNGLKKLFEHKVITWVLNSNGVGKKSISFPYGNGNSISEWRNCTDGCYCKHNSTSLNEWLDAKNYAFFEQIPLPCKSGTLSKAMKAAVMLNFFDIFPRQDAKYTREELVRKVESQFYIYGCENQHAYANLMVDEMLRLKLIKVIKNDPMERIKIFSKRIFKMSNNLGADLQSKQEDILYYIAKNSTDDLQESLDSF